MLGGGIESQGKKDRDDNRNKGTLKSKKEDKGKQEVRGSKGKRRKGVIEEDRATESEGKAVSYHS